MTRKKVKILISVLLILIFVFQFVPLLSGNPGNGGSPVENRGLLIACNPGAHAQTVLQDGRRPLFQLLNAKTGWFEEPESGSRNFATQYTNQKGIIVNTHKKIEDLISLYFHGSKYKDAYLLA